MDEDLALFSNAFPCNPRPFRTALRHFIASGGDITSDHAKRILFTLTGIIRGQLSRIDLAGAAELHRQHLARLPGRDAPLGVLDAMEREAEGFDTRLTTHQWWTSIASLIFFAWGADGTLDLCAEWSRLNDAWRERCRQLMAA